MKLKHQVILLLALPLAFQLAFACASIYLLRNLQEAGEKESRAKEVVIACQDMRDKLNRYIMLLSARRYTDQIEARILREHIQKSISGQISTLQTRMGDDEWSRGLLKRYENDLQRFSDLVRDYTESHASGGRIYLSRFLQESEYIEELMNAFIVVSKDEKEITAHFKPRVEALQPQAQRTRNAIMAILITTVVFDTSLVIALGVIFGKHTVARLQQLMGHIDDFNNGKVNQTAVPGTDEIAEIDAKFRQIAQAKMESEELRRAMYGMVSHDLRSPLTSIGLTIDNLLINKDAGFDNSSRRSLTRAASELQRLIRLASSFLDGQKLETGQLELRTQLRTADELVTAATIAITATAEYKNITVSSNVAATDPDNPLEIECDPDRVIQVLVNLLSNAVKFSPNQAAIAINVTKTNNNSVRFEVVDQAPKLSEDERAELFKPFSKSKDSSGTLHEAGTGLGLYLCKLIVEAHSGTIGISDIDDGHKSFWFEIPQPTSGV